MASILQEWLEKLKSPQRNLELERKVQEMFPQRGIVVNGYIQPSSGDGEPTVEEIQQRFRNRFPLLGAAQDKAEEIHQKELKHMKELQSLFPERFPTPGAAKGGLDQIFLHNLRQKNIADEAKDRKENPLKYML